MASATISLPSQTVAPRPPVAVWTLCVLGSAALLIAGPESAANLHRHVAAWVTFAVLLGLMLHGHSTAKKAGENPWVAPQFLCMFLYWFRFGWGTLVTTYWSELPWKENPWLAFLYQWNGVEQHIVPACWMILLGAFGLYLGLGTRVDRVVAILPDARWRLDEKRFKKTLSLALPVLLLVYLVIQYRLPLALQYVVGIVGVAVHPAILIISYWRFSATASAERAFWTTYLLLVVGCAALAGILTGMLGGLLHPIMGVVLGYVLATRRVPWKLAAVAAPLLLLVVMPVLTVFKYSSHNEATPEDRLRNTLQLLSTGSYRAAMERTVERFGARLAGTEFPAIFYEYFPAAYDFERGRTFMIEASGLVPRVLWPEKPFVSPELNEYSRKVGIVGIDVESSSVFDAVSEYYVNFGMAGVLLLSIVHGWYLAIQYTWLTRRGHYVIGAAIFLVLTTQNLDSFGWINLFVEQTKPIVAWLLLFFVLSRAKGTTTHA